MNVAIIPARAGSARVPGKNKRPFFGRPIILYAIDLAQHCGLFDQIFVSSDDAEIIDLASKNGCFVHLRSTEYLCGPIAGTQEVATDCVLTAVSPNATNCCVIYPTAGPFILQHDLAYGLALVQRENVGYAFAMGEHPPRDAGQFYWGRQTAFANSLDLLGSWTRIVKVPEERICDINTEEDWKRAEEMYHRMRGAVT